MPDDVQEQHLDQEQQQQAPETPKPEKTVSFKVYSDLKQRLDELEKAQNERLKKSAEKKGDYEKLIGLKDKELTDLRGELGRMRLEQTIARSLGKHAEAVDPEWLVSHAAKLGFKDLNDPEVFQTVVEDFKTKYPKIFADNSEVSTPGGSGTVNKSQGKDQRPISDKAAMEKAFWSIFPQRRLPNG